MSEWVTDWVSEGPTQRNLPISRVQKQENQLGSMSMGAKLVPVERKKLNALFSSVTFFQQNLSDGNAPIFAI